MNISIHIKKSCEPFATSWGVYDENGFVVPCIIPKWTAMPIAISCQKLKKTTAFTHTNLPNGRYGANSSMHAW